MVGVRGRICKIIDFDFVIFFEDSSSVKNASFSNAVGMNRYKKNSNKFFLKRKTP